MPEMMTVKEAMAALRLSDQTIRRYIKNRKLRGRKVGRQYLIPKDQIEDLVTLQSEAHE